MPEAAATRFALQIMTQIRHSKNRAIRRILTIQFASPNILDAERALSVMPPKVAICFGHHRGMRMCSEGQRERETPGNGQAKSSRKRQGIFIFDEPESAPSPSRQVAFPKLLRRMPTLRLSS